MQILARMNLIGEVDALFVEGIEDRPPALTELGEGGLDQAGWPLRPGIDVGPGQRAGEGDMRAEPKPPRGLGGVAHLLHRPFLPRARIAAHRGIGEAVEGGIERRMHGDELPLEMGRQLGDGQPVLCHRAFHLVAIGIGLGGLGEVEQPPVPARYLNAFIAERGRPAADGVERIEGGRVSGKLRQKNRRAFHGFHGQPL